MEPARLLRTLCLGLICLWVVGACTMPQSINLPSMPGVPAAVQPQQSQALAVDQTLRMAAGDDVASLDPAQLFAPEDIEIAQNVFDGLVRYDDNLEIVPDLAQTLPMVSPDQRTYTFKLRPDAAFSNGDKVTARDVIYSWERAAAAQGPYATTLSPILGYNRLSAQAPQPARLEQLLATNDATIRLAGLSAPDASTVIVRLAQPAGWFLSALALPGSAGAIVDQKVVQKDPTGWWSKPETLIGTGPYRLSAWAPGVSLDFSPVPNWWGVPKPTVQHLHIDIVASSAARELAYEQGKYDLEGFLGAGDPAPQDMAMLDGMSTMAGQIHLQPGSGAVWVSFNLTHDAARPAQGPFLDNTGQAGHDLRLAFALAIDRRKLTKAVCAGMICAPATGGLIPKGLRGYGGDGSDPLAAFDPALARALLKNADPTGALTRGLTFAYDSESTLYQGLAENLRAQWQANLGVTVTIQAVPHEQLLKDSRAGKLVLSRAGWQADYDNPEDWYDNLFGRVAGCPDNNCVSGYDSVAFDQLAIRAAASALPDALPLYRQMGQALSADAAYIPLYYTMRAFLIRPYVRGAGGNNLFEHPWDEYQVLQH